MGSFIQVSSALVMVAMVSVALATAQDSSCNCDISQYQRMENRITDLEELTSSLQSTVVKLRQETNKMKKLTVASLNIALTPEEQQCKQNKELVDIIGGLSIYVGLGPNSCELMGTALYPAMSCSQLHEACHKPSGNYFIRGTVYSELYCEMDEFDGGWSRFGRGGMEFVWDYVDEDEQEVSLDIIQPQEIKLIKDLQFNTFRILTDVDFALQADHSIDLSTLVTRSLPWMEEETISIGNSSVDYTRLELTDEGDRLNCFHGGSSSSNQYCALYDMLRTDIPSKRLVLTSVTFRPRAADGMPPLNAHLRPNKYTWSGSHYYILAK